MSPTEQAVLRSLVDAEDYGDFCYLNFATICLDARLDRKQVRRACRALARKGFAKFGKGLWTQDGDPAGSGYCATNLGIQALALVTPTPHNQSEK